MRLQPDGLRRHPHPGQRVVHRLLHVLVFKALKCQARDGLVKRVADDGTTQARELGADLVLPPRHEADGGLVVRLVCREVRHNRLALDDFQHAAGPRLRSDARFVGLLFLESQDFTSCVFVMRCGLPWLSS